MAKLSALRRILSVATSVVILLLPEPLHAGVSLIGDLEYFFSTNTSTDKATGDVTDSEFSRFSQLYRLDLSRQFYPKLLFNLGGTYENEDTTSQVQAFDLPESSVDISERTILPYVSVDLNDPIYRANLGYRTRDVETSRSVGGDENLMINEYTGLFNWRPVDLPQFNVNYRRTEVQDDPLTIDSTNDVLNAITNYTYRDYRFQYSFNGRDTYDNIRDSGNLTESHNGRVLYHRGFEYLNNRFDVNAAARIIQSSVEFTGAGSGDETVDTPADEQGEPFYILNDATPASNEPFELVLVETGSPLTNVNIGRGGGISPVSTGLSFGISTEVVTIYISLSEDAERFPDLASPSQIAGIESSLRWQLYSSDDQFELNWTEHPISSATYDSVENRFEIRLSSTVSARRIKVTTTPLHLLAPGEIRYQSIRAFTSLSGQDPENLDQKYSFGINWTPGKRTTLGYEGDYRDQQSEPGNSERTSWTNSMFFRQVLSQTFSTYGRYFRIDRTRISGQKAAAAVEDTDQTYSLALKGDYLETLNQSLIFSGSQSNKSRGDSDTKSVLLRTNADLYTGWSMNMDLGYALNTPESGADQTVKSLYLETHIQPNRRIDLNFDYSAIWTEETDREDNWSQYGTIQVLLVITDTLNTFFRHTFRDQESATDYSATLQELNVNWSPFPDGDLRFTLGYSESTDEADQKFKSIAPSLTWKVSRGIFLELRHDTGTLETPTESRDHSSYMAKFRIFY
ncbi:MAG: hypothetical protein ACYDBT_12120 [Desulfobulbaceae bacterium]